MTIIHTTRKWDTYPQELRELADRIAAPWVPLGDSCLGPHSQSGPLGSYSLLEPEGPDSRKERIIKIFIMEGPDPLPEGVYIGIRWKCPREPGSNIPSREDRIWQVVFQEKPANRAFFAAISEKQDHIGFTPQQHVLFRYMRVPSGTSQAYLNDR